MAFNPKNAKLVTESFNPARAVPVDDFSWETTARNIPSSALQYGKDMVYPLMHPQETAEAMGNLFSGLGEKTNRLLGLDYQPENKEQYADAMAEFIKDRYGSMDAFKDTVMRDPVGVAGDIAMVVGTAGAGAAALPGRVGKAGQVLRGVGLAIDPINVATNLGKTGAHTAAKILPRSIPESMYDSAVKWSTVADLRYGPGTRKARTQTALREGIPPTEAGVGRLFALKNELGRQLDAVIDAAGDGPVDVARVRESLNKTRQELGGFKMKSPENLQAIDLIEARFDDLVAQKMGRVTARDLQDFKVDLGAEITWEKTSPAASRAENLAYKDMRRAAREALEDINPDIAEINQRLAGLLDIQDDLIRAAGRIDNKNIIGLSEPLMIGAGAAATTATDMGSTVGAVGGGVLAAIKRKSAEIAVSMEKLRRMGYAEPYIQNNWLPAALRQGAAEVGQLTQQSDQDQINQ